MLPPEYSLSNFSAEVELCRLTASHYLLKLKFTQEDVLGDQMLERSRKDPLVNMMAVMK